MPAQYCWVRTTAQRRVLPSAYVHSLACCPARYLFLLRLLPCLGPLPPQVVGPRNKAATARGSKEVAERTPVSQLFGGAMQSTVRMRPVGPGAPSKPSVTQQPMFAVHLEAHHNSLEEAFVALTRPEQISGGCSGWAERGGCVLRCAVRAWSEGRWSSRQPPSPPHSSRGRPAVLFCPVMCLTPQATRQMTRLRQQTRRRPTSWQHCHRYEASSLPCVVHKQLIGSTGQRVALHCTDDTGFSVS